MKKFNRMKYIHFFLATCILLIQACKTKSYEEYELPKPKIVISNPIPCINEEVVIYYQTDISASPLWTLNGKELSDNAILKQTFTKEGMYNIILTLTDGKGGKVSVTQEVEVLGESLTLSLQELIKNPDKIWICSHRANTREGMTSADIPENSIEGIKEAIKKGSEIIEIDVRSSFDGHFVLMHDETVDRTTNGSGLVKNKTWAELRTLKLRTNRGVLTNHTIPTLKEALLAGRGKVFFNLDIAGKQDNMQKMAILVDSLHMSDRVVFYVGSDKEMAQTILSANKKAIIFPWISSMADIDYYSSNGRINMMQIAYTGNAAANLVSYGRTKKMIAFSNALGDVDEALLKHNFTEIEKMKAINLQVIQTDYVEVLKNYLGN